MGAARRGRCRDGSATADAALYTGPKRIAPAGSRGLTGLSARASGSHMLAPLLYPTAEAYLAAPEKSVALFGMSGLGKTHLARMLRAEGGWFHYSIDYRIGTRYLGEAIDDNLKREAMKSAFFRPLLLSDGIRISSKIAFENLAPLSTWLGKPGDAARGGLIFEDYVSRQRLHRAAEIGALCDTGHFVRRSREIYGYRNFLADTGGSICEVVEPANPDDPVMRHLSSVALPVLLRGSEADAEILAERFARNPKPDLFPRGLSAGRLDALSGGP